MKDLSNLSPAFGSNHRRKRLGRGIGSGLGKTAGKGHKGQLARAGGVVAPGFEGGQNPLYKRVPKFGFSNRRKMVRFNIVKLEALNVFANGETVDMTSLQTKNLIENPSWPIKILVKGELTKKLTVKVDKLTANAKAAIEKVGGSTV